MSLDSSTLDSLLRASDLFNRTLDAATVPAADGGRKVGGVPHAIALSEASDSLCRELAAAHGARFRQHPFESGQASLLAYRLVQCLQPLYDSLYLYVNGVGIVLLPP